MHCVLPLSEVAIINLCCAYNYNEKKSLAAEKGNNRCRRNSHIHYGRYFPVCCGGGGVGKETTGAYGEHRGIISDKTSFRSTCGPEYTRVE